MKRILIVLAIILLIFSTNSFAQDRATTLSGIDTNLPSSSKLTALQLRTALKAIANSAFDGIDTKMTQAEADSRYPRISDGDPTPIYTASEVNALLKEARKSELLKTLQDQGSDVKSITAGSTNLWYGSQAMTDGRAYQATHIVEDTITVTGVGWSLTTQGNFNGDNYNGFFLCSVSGANYTVIASTANDATIWKKTINTYSKKDFTTPVVLPPGVYKLFGVWNTSDASPAVIPIFYSGQGGGNSTQYSQMTTNGHKFEGYITTATTAVPVASFASSTLTSAAVSPSFLLY